jgi:hypothetical protein
MAKEYQYPRWIESALQNGYFSEYNNETKGWKYKNPNKEKSYKFEFNPIKDHDIKRGDIINFEGSYRNEGKWIWGGTKIENLYTEVDDYGSVPPEFKVGKDFQPNHWIDVVDHNSIIWLEDELIENIEVYAEDNNMYGRVKIFDTNYNIFIDCYRLNPHGLKKDNNILIKDVKEYIQKEKPCFNYVGKRQLEVYI